jgi:hypothetical protein
VNTKDSIMPPVLLTQLAGAAFSGSVDSATNWVSRVGGTIDRDWAGRPIVDAEIARRVLEDSRMDSHASNCEPVRSERRPASL